MNNIDMINSVIHVSYPLNKKAKRGPAKSRRLLP